MKVSLISQSPYFLNSYNEHLSFLEIKEAEEVLELLSENNASFPVSEV